MGWTVKHVCEALLKDELTLEQAIWHLEDIRKDREARGHNHHTNN